MILHNVNVYMLFFMSLFTCFEFVCYKLNLDLTYKKYITPMFGVRVTLEGISSDGVDINSRLSFTICVIRETRTDGFS